MQIFKFGGASVRDAQNIENVGKILKTFDGIEKIVVISAIGKTTNHLENAINLYVNHDDAYIQMNDTHQFIE